MRVSNVERAGRELREWLSVAWAQSKDTERYNKLSWREGEHYISQLLRTARDAESRVEEWREYISQVRPMSFTRDEPKPEPDTLPIMACGCPVSAWTTQKHEVEHARELGHGIKTLHRYSDVRSSVECECGYQTGHVLLSIAMQAWREHVRVKLGLMAEPGTMAIMACGCESSGPKIDFKHEYEHARALGHGLNVRGNECVCGWQDSGVGPGVQRWRSHVLEVTGLGEREPGHTPEVYEAQPSAHRGSTQYVRCSCGWGTNDWYMVGHDGWREHIVSIRALMVEAEREPDHTFKGFMFSADGVTATCLCGWATIGQSKNNAHVAWQGHADMATTPLPGESVNTELHTATGGIAKEAAKPEDLPNLDGVIARAREREKRPFKYSELVTDGSRTVHTGGVVSGAKQYVAHKGEGHLTQRFTREVDCPSCKGQGYLGAPHVEPGNQCELCEGRGQLIEHLTVTMDIDSDAVLMLGAAVAEALEDEGFKSESSPIGETVRELKDKQPKGESE